MLNGVYGTMGSLGTMCFRVYTNNSVTEEIGYCFNYSVPVPIGYPAPDVRVRQPKRRVTNLPGCPSSRAVIISQELDQCLQMALLDTYCA